MVFMTNKDLRERDRESMEREWSIGNSATRPTPRTFKSKSFDLGTGKTFEPSPKGETTRTYLDKGGRIQRRESLFSRSARNNPIRERVRNIAGKARRGYSNTKREIRDNIRDERLGKIETDIELIRSGLDDHIDNVLNFNGYESVGGSVVPIAEDKPEKPQGRKIMISVGDKKITIQDDPKAAAAQKAKEEGSVGWYERFVADTLGRPAPKAESKPVNRTFTAGGSKVRISEGRRKKPEDDWLKGIVPDISAAYKHPERHLGLGPVLNRSASKQRTYFDSGLSDAVVMKELRDLTSGFMGASKVRAVRNHEEADMRKFLRQFDLGGKSSTFKVDIPKVDFGLSWFGTTPKGRRRRR